MQDIQITRVREEPGETALKVEIPVERVRAAEARATQTVARGARIPGFRKGKAPPAVVRKKFAGAIRESVIQDLISDSWKEVIQRESLEPIADPRIRDLSFHDDQPVTFELLVEVMPELKLERFSGFKLTRKSEAVSDLMVDEQLDQLRRKKAPWQPVNEGNPVEGDLVSATVAVIEEGKGPEDKPVQFVLGDGSAIPSIEERLMEMSAGEVRDTTVTYPDDFEDESKRGQSRAVRIGLQDFKRQDLPVVDDDFAREVGDFETMDDLKKAIRSDLEESARRDADSEVKYQLMQQIVAANNVVVPRSMVGRALQNMAGAYGIQENQWEQFAGQFEQIAEQQVARELVLDHFEKQENLTATEDEVDKRIEEIAGRRGVSPGDIYQQFQKAGGLREIERGITQRKVYDFLLAKQEIADEA